MYDPGERAEFLKEFEAKVAKAMSSEGRANLIARGFDPEAEFKKLTAAKDAFLAADDDYEQAHEDLLQKTANQADSVYAVFKALRDVIKEAREINPLDPRLEEWEDQLEAMAELMPKEPEE